MYTPKRIQFVWVTDLRTGRRVRHILGITPQRPPAPPKPEPEPHPTNMADLANSLLSDMYSVDR